MCQKPLFSVNCVFWIRRSTGRLCADLTSSPFYDSNDYLPHFYCPPRGRRISMPDNIMSLNPRNQETIAFSSLTLKRYHELCSCRLSGYRYISCTAQATVNLGAIISCSSSCRLEDSVEIASLPNLDFCYSGWNIGGKAVGKIVEQGWTRYTSCELRGNGCSSHITLERHSPVEVWFSQAHYIFGCLNITSNYENYVFISQLIYSLTISFVYNTPEGYLFLCPMEELQTGPCSLRWPNCPAYWSLDASGGERLGSEEARRLGFPRIEFDMKIYGRSWDTTFYAGLRKFYQAKGFDPDTQDVARHLEYSLYQFNEEAPCPHNKDNLSGLEADKCGLPLIPKSNERREFVEKSLHESQTLEATEICTLQADSPALPRPWNLIMFTKSMLIIFLALSLLYEYMLA
ncbi:hypothetical protein C8R44DRAFT_798658 [Mycena epipterygia]|nr:hypothetical protein C8R44DRAFT_798658 [Mycena epipterygia]